MSNKYKINKHEVSYPSDDFINEKFDFNEDSCLNKLVLIISTPRSGSTYLCEQIYKATGAIGHEYFQPYGYIQCLAKRWGCMENGEINKEIFIENLIRYRSKSGALVINLHASHLPIFVEFLNSFPSVEIRCVHLIRGDEVSQAVSYYIASSTGVWSSSYPLGNAEEPDYDYFKIEEKLKKLQLDNLYARCFIERVGLNYKPVFYEELKKQIKDIVFYLFDKKIVVKKDSGRLKKQSTGLNGYFIKRFSFDMFERGSKESG